MTRTIWMRSSWLRIATIDDVELWSSRLSKIKVLGFSFGLDLMNGFFSLDRTIDRRCHEGRIKDDGRY